MLIWLRIAIQSALARRGALLIMVLSTAISVAILLGVFKIRDDTKTSFSNAISGVDLVVGAKGSPTELILYSVFHIGRASNTIPATLEKNLVEDLRQVAWVVPVQLGDSYRNYPVVGTSIDFFKRVKAQGRHLQLAQGSALSNPHLFDVVLGHTVAKNTQHRIGEQIAISHGSGSGPKQDHSNSPFRIIGILEANGTPIDNAVFISTNAFDALHDIADSGLQFARLNPDSQASAFFIGLKDRGSVFSVRRQIDSLPNSLMAVMPGVALDELWSSMEIAENALLLIALGVLITTILGITATLLVSLESRRRELAIFRAVGAKPYQLLSLILAEAFMVCVIGILLGWSLLQLIILTTNDHLRKEWGVVSEPSLPNIHDGLALLYLVLVVLISASIPAIKAYRMALSEGLNPPS